MMDKQIIDQYTQEEEVIDSLLAKQKALDEKIAALKAAHKITAEKVIARAIETKDYTATNSTGTLKVEVKASKSYKFNTEQLRPAERKMLIKAVLQQTLEDKRVKLVLEDVPSTMLKVFGLTEKYAPEYFKETSTLKVSVKENKL